MADKYAAFGAQIQTQISSAWTEIAGVRDISGPSMSADTTDVTSHSSPSAFREFVATLLDAGEITFDLVFDPEELVGQEVLLTEFLARTLRDYRLVFATTNSKTWAVSAQVVNFEASNPVEGEISASITMKVSGSPNFSV
jgi:predicted secreted protein